MEGKSALLGLITGAADTDTKREMTHVYKVVFGKNGDDKVAAYGDPVYSARYAQNNAVVTDCLQQPSELPEATREPTGPACIDGKQTWTGYTFPGLLTDTSKVKKDTSVAGRFKIPANLHVGSMGLAPSEVDFADSIPPMVNCGNAG